MSYIPTVISILRPYAIPLLTTAGAGGIYLAYRCIHCVKKCFSDYHRRRLQYQEVVNFTKKLFDRVTERVVVPYKIDKTDGLEPCYQEILRTLDNGAETIDPNYVWAMPVALKPVQGTNGEIFKPAEEDNLRILNRAGALVPLPGDSVGFLLTSKKLVIQFPGNNPLQGLFTSYPKLEELFEDIEELFALLEHRFTSFRDKGLNLLLAQVKKKEEEDRMKLERSQHKSPAKKNRKPQYQKPATSILHCVLEDIKAIKKSLNEDIEFCRNTRKLYEFSKANKWQTYLLYAHILRYFKDMLSEATTYVNLRTHGIKLGMRNNRFIVNFVDEYLSRNLVNFKNWYFILKRIYPYAQEACDLLDIELPFIDINRLDCSENFKGILRKLDYLFSQKEKRVRKAATREVCESKAFDSKHGYGTDQEYGSYSTTSSSWTKLKKKSKKLPGEPALSSVQKTKFDVEKARAEKEESEKVKAEGRKEDNLRKYRLIAPHQFSIKIVPALSTKNRETLDTLYGMNGSYDHRITNQDIVLLANNVKDCIKREFQNQFADCIDKFIESLEKFTDEVGDRDHPVHEGRGKKLPASYVNIRRSTFIRYGLWPTGWGPNNERENEDQQIYFERAIATVFGHEVEEEREEVEKDEETEIE